MAKNNNSNYAGNLARAVGQGITFGFGDELEARYRALTGGRSYDEEVADIRESIEQFRETNPYAAYGSEFVGSIPTGLGLAGLALRGGIRGAAKIGALEGSIYGAGEGEGVEGTTTSAAIGAGLGGALGKAGEKAFEGIAPLVGKFMKTRGSGAEVKGSGAIELEAGSSDLGPMVREAGSDEFVPLVNKVGEPGSRDLRKYDEFFESMGPEGAGMEFPAVGRAIDSYAMELDPEESFAVLDEALVSNDYPGYAAALRANLNRQFPGDKISVSRIENSSDPSAGLEGRESRGFFEIDKDDVLFAGNGSERELIIRSPERNGAPMSVRLEASRPSDLGSLGANPAVRTGDDVFDGDSSVATPSQLVRAKGSFDYSPIDNALTNAETLMNAGRKGLTGEQYLARLPNQDSITKTEMETSGLAAFLSKPENLRRKIPAEDLRTYLDENAPRLNYYRFDGELDDNYMESQRFMNPYGDGYYGEIAVSNSNTPQQAQTYFRSHHADMPGTIAHTRFSDHSIVDSDTNVLDIRVLEENQFDALSQQLKPKGAGVDYPLDKAKVAEFDAKIDQLRDSAGYAQVSQARDAFLDSQVELRKLKEEISQAERGITNAKFRTSLPAGAEGKVLDSFQNLGKQYATLSPVRVDASIDLIAPDLLHTMVVSLPEDVVKNGKHKVSQAVREALTNPDFSDDRSSQWYRGLYDAVDSFGEASGLTLVEAFDRIAPGILKTLDSRVGSVTMQNAYEDSVKVVGLRKHLKELPLKLKEQHKRTNALEDKRTQTAVKFLEDNLKGTDTDTMALMNYMTPSGFMPPSVLNRLSLRKFDGDQLKKYDQFTFAPTQPFKTPMQAARNNIYAVVQNALQENIDRVYFPDYEDIASHPERGVNPEGFIKTVYKDAPEKVIKELKQVYPGLEAGTVSINDFRSLFSDPEAVMGSAKGNLRYIDLRRIDMDRFKPRRFAQGGKVDLRSGIGDMFRLYS